jgi:hypothetical protein
LHVAAICGPTCTMPGHRQRRENEALAAADGSNDDESGSDDIVDSPLGTSLLKRFFWGKITGVDVNEFAHSAVLEGARSNEVALLASLGAFGQNPGSCHHQIVTKYCKLSHVPPTMRVPVPIVRLGTNVVDRDGVVGVLYPHLWAHTMETYYPEVWEKVFGISKVQEFWEAQDMS